MKSSIILYRRQNVIQCKLRINTFVSVQATGCMQMGCTVQEWDMTHTHTHVTDGHCTTLYTSYWSQDHSQLSTPDPVGRGKGSMDGAN